MTVTHAFVSAIEDGEDDSLIRPSDWNAEHIVEGLEGGGGGPHELDYVQITASVNVTATAEASATTIITGNAVTYDGSTTIIVDAFVPIADVNNATDAYIMYWLYDGSSSIGRLGGNQFPTAEGGASAFLSRRLTPTAGSHTYSIRGTTSGGTSIPVAGAGGAGNWMPAFIRITRATGGVTLGSSPGVRVYRASTLTPTADNAYHTIAFDNEEYDTDVYHDNSTNNSRLTVPAGLGGQYMIQGSTGGVASVAAGNYANLAIQKNGTTMLRGTRQGPAHDGNGMKFGTTQAIVDLIAGDYVELLYVTNNTTTWGDTTNLDRMTAFEMVRLGGTPTSADEVDYATGDSGLAATNVQEAIDEIVEGGHALGFVGTQVSRAATQSIGDAVATDISFDTEVFDTDGFWSSGTTVTVPAGLGGKYLAVGYVAWASNGTGHRFAYLTTTGTGSMSDSKNPLSGDVTRHSISAVLTLVPGNTLKMAGYQSSGGALNATGTLSLYKIDTPALGGPPGARAYHATTQGSLANSTLNGLSLNTEDWDTDGFHDTVTNNSRFTIPAGLGGKYLLVGRSTVDQAWEPYWKKNGSTILSATMGPVATGTNGKGINIEDLAAGDYVEFCEYHATGTAIAGHASARHNQTEAVIMRLGGSATEANTMPWHVVIPAETEPDTTINTWSIVLHTEALNFANGGTGVTNGLGTPAQNDEIAWDVVLAAGTWKLTMHSRKSSNVGIYTVSVEGTSVGTIDGYSASAAAGLDTISGIAIATTGKHRLKFKMATKNASSSGYVGNPQAISLRRTA